MLRLALISSYLSPSLAWLTYSKLKLITEIINIILNKSVLIFYSLQVKFGSIIEACVRKNVGTSAEFHFFAQLEANFILKIPF